MSKSKLQEELKRIEAKLGLGMKVSNYEWALYILYRDNKAVQ